MEKEELKEEIINIHGFSLRANTMYEVVEKIDTSAPESYVKFGTSKSLQVGIHNSEPVATYNESMKIWDTGLFEESPLLGSVIPDTAARKTVVLKLNQHIVKELEKVQGKGRLGHVENDDYWLDYRTEVKVGRVFNTAKPKETLELYLLLLDKRLTPEHHVSHPDYKFSQYIVKDKELVFAKETTKVLSKFKVVGTFTAMLESNRQQLIEILKFLGLSCNEDTPDESLYMSFDAYLNDPLYSFQNPKDFLKACEDASTTSGKETIYIYNKLKYMVSKGIVDRTGKGDIKLGDLVLGSNYHAAAEKVYKDKKILKAFYSLLE